MSIFHDFDYSPNAREPQEIEFVRQEILRVGQWRGLLFFASVCLQALAGVSLLNRMESWVSYAPLTFTTALAAFWYWLWYQAGDKYRRMRATFMNADQSEEASISGRLPPFWADRDRILLVLMFYIQVVATCGFLLWQSPDPASNLRNLGEGFLMVVATIGPAVTWPAAVVMAAFCWQQQFGTQRMRSSGDAIRARNEFQNQVMTLEVRADNAKLPEPATPTNGTQEREIPQDAYRLLIQHAPGAAIMLAWRDVEMAVQEMSKRNGAKYRNHLTTGDLREVLEKLGMELPSEITSILGELRRIRNKAARQGSGGDKLISSYTAEEFLRLSRRIIAWLQQLPTVWEKRGEHYPPGEYTVILQGLTSHEKTIQLIRVVREIIRCDLPVGKKLVEEVPKVVVARVSKDSAEAISKLLEDAGGKTVVTKNEALVSA